MPTILNIRSSRLALLPALVVGLLVASPAREGQSAPPTPEDGWVAFEATWSASGSRNVLPYGEGEAATFRLSGALVVVRGEGLRKGFRAEAIGYDDGKGSGVGAMALTDDRGDQVFCDLTGSASERDKAVSGAITGGTGVYAGITGELSFVWRHLVRTGDGEIQGLAENL